MTIWTRAANRLLQALFPLAVVRSYQAFSTENWLADVEADHDSWAPDELWAAQQRHPAGEPSETARGKHHAFPPRLSVVPPAADGQPVQSPVGGRHSKPDNRTNQDVIEELVEDYRQFITECFERRLRN